ncbi:MAG: lysophospholipid acyltransferase family protein [Planctomycetes bacterium]|nr:lysophospholipid acyltransferase family protein [Planctomycetota bacterium]
MPEADAEAPAEPTRAGLFERLGTLLLRGLIGVIRLIPLPLARGLGRFTGSVISLLGGSYWAEVDHNLRVAFGPDLPRAERRRIARRFWRHLGALAAETCHLGNWDRARGERELDASELLSVPVVKEGKRGIIFAVGHFGTWELGPYVMGLCGYPMHLIYNPGTSQALHELLKRERERSGMQVVSRHKHPWALKKLLDKGAWLAVAADLNAGRKGTFIPLMGVQASSYTTLAALQKVSGAPIVVATTARQADDTHKVHVWDIIELPRGPIVEAELIETTARINRALGRAFRAYPEQWLWTYRRWRRRPPGEVLDAEGFPPRVAEPDGASESTASPIAEVQPS